MKNGPVDFKIVGMERIANRLRIRIKIAEKTAIAPVFSRI